MPAPTLFRRVPRKGRRAPVGALSLCAGLAALCLAAPSAQALESLALYDDFGAPTLDPQHWAADLQSRGVEGEALRLRWRGRGGSASDSGTALMDGRRVSIARALPVTKLRANVRVTALELTGCAANPTPTSVSAGIGGLFFNTGNRGSGSSVGDVAATLWATRDSASADAPGVLRVQGRIFLCTDRHCDAMSQLGSTVDLGAVASGTGVLLQLEWDRANKRFLFSRDGGPAAPLAYTLDDSADPGRQYKSLMAATTIANCASGPRALGAIDARFDKVAVNASAGP